MNSLLCVARTAEASWGRLDSVFLVSSVMKRSLQSAWAGGILTLNESKTRGHKQQLQIPPGSNSHNSVFPCFYHRSIDRSIFLVLHYCLTQYLCNHHLINILRLMIRDWSVIRSLSIPTEMFHVTLHFCFVLTSEVSLELTVHWFEWGMPTVLTVSETLNYHTPLPLACWIVVLIMWLYVCLFSVQLTNQLPVFWN